uniref:DBP10 C-terminal domain-containing protein n=1 Tax=Pipistrellus kuhlii TaxID=59472 RepID=A0A7J7V5V0_PIPKU|nr:hypothetical protein mPipKuh1_008561 [Pipistrellus kuhlii]
MLGRVPQSIVDDEDSGLWNTPEVSLQLWGLGCVADNAQQQYVKLAAFALSGVHQPGPEQPGDAAKWHKDCKAIFSFQQDRKEWQEGLAGLATSCPGLQVEHPGKEEEKPKDFDSKPGLSIGGERGAFEQQVAGAALDLMGDEDQNLTRGWEQLKWDQKKGFLGQSGQEDKKKIKTESSHYISSFYKQDLYGKWKQKQKIAISSMPEPSGLQAFGPVRGIVWVGSSQGMCRR